MKILIRVASFIYRIWKIKKNPITYARNIGVKIGYNCKIIGMDSATFGSEPYLVQLGDKVEITYGVRFITHDGGVWVGRNIFPELDIIEPIVVGNNVFIGNNALILRGVTIGDNVVIGAGSVVTRDIPSNTVAAGVPAKKISSTDHYIKKSRERSLDIHLLNDVEKKRYLIEHYKLNI